MEFPELLILQLIAQQPMYGYEIVGAIRLRSEEALSIGEGSIYPILHRLEKRKLIRGRRENVKGRNRVTYKLTQRGHKQLAESVHNWRRITRAVDKVLGGGQDVVPNPA